LEVEADLEEQQGDILVQYHESSEFDWASHSASELEKLNHTACQWLSDRGYNSSSLKVKANVRSRNFDSRIPKDAPVEERVKAIVKSGISLNSLMYTIGPSCLSSDEIFQAFEYRELLKVYNTAKKDRAAFDKKKKLETSAKALLALNKTTYTMSEKQLLLRWKLGDEGYAPHAKKKSAEINAVWLEHQNEQNPEDMLDLPELEEPQVPPIDETELGRARRRQFNSIMSNTNQFDNEQLSEMARLIFSLCNVRGIEV
jgi:hypothetical protein